MTTSSLLLILGMQRVQALKPHSLPWQVSMLVIMMVMVAGQAQTLLQWQQDDACDASAFDSLSASCTPTYVRVQVDKYTYSVCPFKDAFQKEGAGRTSLGTWAGLSEDSSVMSFTGGQACWQGPARSMTVSNDISQLVG